MEQEHEESSPSPSSSPPPEHSKTTKAPHYADEEEEDIWPEEVENYFQEALKIYPPIGRRKLLENGKMYGRNELIAKYIFQKTGKVRTRKQVSSHIQVLGKKNKKGPEASSSSTASASKPSQPRASASASSSKPSQTQASRPHEAHPSPPRPVPAQTFPMVAYPTGVAAYPIPQHAAPGYGYPTSGIINIAQPHDYAASYSGQPLQYLPQSPIVDTNYPSALRGLPVQLKHFYAYLEHAGAPLNGMVNRHYYVSLNGADFEDSTDEVQIDHVEGRYFGLRELFDKGSYNCFFLAKCYVNANSQQNYGLHALFVKYESRQRMTLKCSTTVYSFGKAVVEKIQVEDPILEYNTYAYYFNHSPMCDYMVQFIDKLKGLNDTSKMNRVLENFSCLQVIIDTQTNTTLMCTAFLFEVAEGGVIRNKVMRLVQPK